MNSKFSIVTAVIVILVNLGSPYLTAVAVILVNRKFSISYCCCGYTCESYVLYNILLLL